MMINITRAPRLAQQQDEPDWSIPINKLVRAITKQTSDVPWEDECKKSKPFSGVKFEPDSVQRKMLLDGVKHVD